jgi:hypothetical protein
MTGHVSPQSLARWAEGLLRHGRAARIRAHLASCPQCAAEQAQLTEVSAVLRDVPAAPLPPAVAARLDAALIAESARRAAQPAGAAPGNGATQPARASEHAVAPEPAGAPGPAGAGHGGDGGAGRTRRPAGPAGRWRWLQAPAAVRGLAAAAAVVVLGGVGYGIVQAVSSTSSGLGTSSSSSSSSGRAAKPAVGVPGAGGPGMHQNSAAGSGATITVTRTGTRYQPGTLGQQAAAVLAEHPPAAQRHSPGTAGPLARQGTGAALQGCVQRIAAGRPVQLVDEGSYRGRPALIIVVQGHPPKVYVTSPGCTAAHPGVRAQAPLAAAG